MQIRSFAVPFARVVEGTDSHELAFDEGDYLVVRPIFALPSRAIRDVRDRIAAMTETSTDAEADALTLDLIAHTVAEWHLAGPDGPIAKPATAADLNELPGVLRGALFGFLSSYRGEGPDPTPAA